MKKQRVFLLTLVIILATISCEIGLGSAVDTEVPEIAIETPVAGAIIRDTFAIGGNWSDDGSIKDVSILIKNTENNSEYGPFEASFTTGENGKGGWSYTVDKKLLPDGTYEAIVTITDEMEHKTETQRQITVDNTSPVLVLQRPSTKNNETRVIESYGRIFTIDGQAADDSGIGLLEVNVYSDAELKNLLKTISFTSVPNTISLDVAEFVKGVNNDYSAIYGSTNENAGEKKLYCTIIAYDGAKRYPPNGAAQTEADLKGNPTEVYYLYSEIADRFLSEHKITELYSMKSGRSAKPSVIQSMPSIAGNSFTLNPKNNPIFSIAGFSEIEENADSAAYEAANLNVNNGDFVTIQVEPGLDGHLLEKDSLVVKVKEAETGNYKTVSEQTISKDGDKYKIIAYMKKEDGLDSSKTYRIEVDGKDEKGNRVTTPRGIGYGFCFKKGSVVPTLEVTDPAREDAKECNAATDSITIKGSVLFPSEICNGGDLIIKGNHHSQEYTWKVGSFEKDANTKWTFNLNLKKDHTETEYDTTDANGNPVTYKYLPDGEWDFTIYGEYYEVGEDTSTTLPEKKYTTKISRNYKVDTRKPATPTLQEVQIGQNAAQPYNAADTYSSQNLKIIVISEDILNPTYSSNIVETWYKVNNEDWARLNSVSEGYINNGLIEGVNRLYFKNIDVLGNESEETSAADAWLLNVDTSIPVVEKVFIGDGEDWLELTAGKVKNISNGHGKKIKVYVKEENSLKETGGVNVTVGSTTISSNSSFPPVYDGALKQWIWTTPADVPFTQNTQTEVKVQAKDNSVGGSSKEVKYSFLVDTLGPDINMVSPEVNLNPADAIISESYTINSSINDDSGEVALTRYKLTSEPLADDAAIRSQASADDYAANGWINSANIKKIELPLTIESGKKSGAITNGKIGEGKWYFYIYSVDDVGNPSVEKREIWTDRALPALEVEVEPVAKYNKTDSETNSTIRVSGTARDENEIKKIEYTIDGSSWTQIPVADITEDTSDSKKVHWTFSKTFGTGGNLADGNYKFGVRATDKAERYTEVEKDVLIDTQVPEITAKEILNAKAWYRNTTVVPEVTASDNISAASKLEVQYKVNDDGSWTSLIYNNESGKFSKGVTVSSNGANKVYFKVKDEAGNESNGSDFLDVNIDTQAPLLTLTKYQVEGKEESTDFTKTVYVDGDDANLKLTLWGQYSDTGSGVKADSLVFNRSGIALASDKVTITPESDGKWKAEISKDELLDGSIGVRVEDNAGNYKYSEQTLSIIKDTDNPVISNVSVKETTVNAKTNAYLSSAEDADPLVYYVNNANKDDQDNIINKKFTISGLSSDDNNIVETKLKIGSTEYTENKGTTPASWSFDIEDLHTYSGTEVSVEIISTDPAGKTAVDHKTITLKFDNAGPDFRHGIDANGKDVDFRVGEYENDAHEEDVGGKYKAGTWGTALSIKVRGTVTDNFDPDSNTSTGSGLSKVYYKVFTAEPTEGATFNKDDEDVGVIEASNLLPKKVDYTKSAGGKAIVPVTSSFKGEIKGLNEGANYILLLAEDNVGNIKQDSMTAVAATNLVTLDPVTDVNGNAYKWNEDKKYYSLNVDTNPPELKTTTKGTQFSNGSKKVTVTGTCSDSNSGIDSVTVSVTIGTGATATRTKDATIDKTKTPYEWSVDLEASELTGIVDGETYSIDAVAKDKAGHTSSLTAAILQGDKKAPTASLISMTNSVEKSGNYYIRPTKDEVKVKVTTDDEYSTKVKTYLKLVPYVSNSAAESATGIKYISTAVPTEDVTAVLPTEDRTWELTIPAGTLTLTGFKGAKLYACTEDDAGNTSAADEGDILLTTLIFDETPPAPVDPDDIAVGGGGNENTWHKNTSLSVSESWKDENGAGLDKVYYKLVHDTTEPVFNEETWAADGWTAFTGSENDSGIYAFENTIDDFIDGANNYVYMYALDKLGNAVTSLHKITIKVDTQAPVASDGYKDSDDEVYNFTEIYLTNGGANKILYFYIEDEHSGIKEDSAVVKLGGIPVELGENKSKVEFTEVPGSNTKKLVKVTLHKDNFTGDGHRPVVVTLQDNAGNYADKTIGTINMDTTAPVVKLNALKDADSTTAITEVNKTIIITGTATDAYLKERPLTALEYSTNGTDWLNLITDFTPTNTNLVNAGDFSITIDTTDTTNTPFTDGTTYYVRAKVMDQAGNPGWSTGTKVNADDDFVPAESGDSEYTPPLIFKVSQDTDRPVIKFTNLELPATSGTTEAKANITLPTTTLSGKITDDDDLYKAANGEYTEETFQISLNGGITWNTISVKNGAWKYDFTENKYEVVFKVKDGAGTTFTTGAATETATTDTVALQTTPKLTDGTNWLGTHIEESHTEFSLIVDEKNPVIQNLKFKLKDENETAWSAALPKLGGPDARELNNKFLLQLDAGDENGITSVTGKLDGNPLTVTINQNGSETPDYSMGDRRVKKTKWQSGVIDVSSLTGGSHSLELTITDGAGNEKKETVTLSIDKEGPEVTMTSPTTNSLESASVWANGTISGARDKGLKYAISTHGDADHKPADTLADASVITAWEEYNDSTNTTAERDLAEDKNYKPHYSDDMDFGINWNIYFDNVTSSTTTTDTHDNLLNQYLVDMGITTVEALRAKDNTQFNKLVKLYLWLKAEDDVGNTTERAFPIILDPQGDRPTLSFTYPEVNAATLGGKVTVYGTVDDTLGDNPGVDSVWVQMIGTHWKENPAYDPDDENSTQPQYIVDTESGYGTFETSANDITSFNLKKKDLDYLVSNGYEVCNINDDSEYNAANVNDDTAGNYAVKARLSGTAWLLDINSNGEFNPPGKDASPVAMRLYARDKDGKFSLKFDRLVKFDANKPVISNLQLVQYKDAANSDYTITASQSYENNIVVKGNWWLTGTVSDGDKIGLLTVNGVKLVETDNDKNINPVEDRAWWATGHDTTEDVVEFRYELSTGDQGTVGEKQVTIVAEDAADGEPNRETKPITVKYDNKRPEIPKNEASGRKISPTVQQYNGFYKFGSWAKETAVGGIKQSGFAYTAFYFKRHYGTTTKLYDVLQARDAACNDISTQETETTSLPDLGEEDDDAAVNSLVTKDELYWFVKTVTTNGTMTIEMSNTANVHKNSLVLIDGTYYLVDSVGNGTVTFTRNIPAGKTKAYVALAGVVNNSNEGHTNSAKPQWPGNGYYATDDLVRDDGDGMIEDVSKLDTTWTWEANICSRNIPDGPVDIVYVVYDQAGNSVSDTVSGFICNNQPRIAGVRILTDYTGDNIIDFEKTDYSAEVRSKDSVTDDSIVTKKVYDPFANSLTKHDVNPIKQDLLEVGTKVAPALRVRGLTQIIPEIVGGNGAVYYSYDITNGAKQLKGKNETPLYRYVKPTAENPNPTQTLNYDYTINDSAAINIQLGDLIDLGNTEGTEGIPFNFTFSDETEGLETYTPEQKTALETQHGVKFEAALKVWLAINAVEESTPVVTIEPFYWKSLKDNSIYGSKTASSYKDLKGHIELEDDWTKEKTAATAATDDTPATPATYYSAYDGNSSGTYLDADPKVSGEIVLKGTAFDAKLLKKIEISITGVSDKIVVADYDSGSLVSKYAAEAYDTKGISFIIDKQTVDSNGHSVEWTLNWNTQNTSFVSTTAKKDVEVKVIATNGGVPKSVPGGTDTNYTSIDGKTIYKADQFEPGTSNEIGDTQTGSKDANGKVIKTAYYRMDVVPYVTDVVTYLSSANKNNPSVYSRTALGHYPVYMTHAKGNGAYTYESDIKIYGFNLTGGKLYFDEGTSGSNSVNLTAATGYYTIQIPKGAKTGKATVSVGTGANAVESLNNKNNDDSNGSSGQTVSSRTGDADIYGTYFYNRQPNEENNNRLTDDLYFDVWDFNSQAAVSQDNSCLDIMMKINPSNGLIGFAFCDGTLHWSMAGKADDGKALSYRSWAEARDFIQLTGFGYDSYGNSYGTAAGGESSGEDKADSYCFYTSRWGKSGVTAHQSNHSRIECTAQKTNSNNENVFTLDKKRFHNPTFAAHTDSSTTHNTDLYLAYYDAVNGEIRFRAGTINDSTGVRAQFGSFIDRYSDNNQDGTRPKDYSYNTNDFQILANGAGANLGTAGEFLSLGVTSDNVVVIIWYDGTDLKLSYNTNPLPKDQNNNIVLPTGTARGGWQDAVSISSGASKYCQLVVDAADNIHVAAYDNANGDLKYIYIPMKTVNNKHVPDTGSRMECIVDSYLNVGKELTIDVAAEVIGGTVRYIPHIGYFGTTPKKPRYAYLADPTAFFAASDTNGRSGTNDDMYTGIWECGVVPSKSTITIDAKRRINVGVWKADVTPQGSTKTIKGMRVTSNYTGFSTGTSTAASKSGTCYGNGTQNAVLAYGVQYSKMRDYVETAQMR